ncbi:uncharacterized protein PHACADRAFT_248904 [Phanerochaete carnosa HHB-10118-sp]|uniref:C2H2-type domain-containing protein n=1 Tax=Phanerochaete carnosa (strain HHB-10118-sp) TaxID=650164 RepID=K5WHM5_PHACS|nr:uncharacterized protein PHACADRAFT_248904 [Phanerochaete carnosa HHB-10118-sp]EKM58820.1 hypothetical protein PHACADRAFT_248904 [Phanerochaete carnosa HHB-10118-sp]
MSSSTSSRAPERISLPSIHEMFPEHLMALPPRREHRASTVAGHPLPHPTVSPLVGNRLRLPVDPLPTAVQTGPEPPQEPTRRADQADEERRHVCLTCGKAFNRPSSLSIHVNTHTGARPFECPFPGCGRRFNVNSNMRRHLRNHNSPSRPLNTASPYTYPLTTVPRPLPPTASTSYGAPVHPPASNHTQYRSSDSGSEEDELSESESWEHEREDELAEEVDRLRLRAHSTSSTASSPRAQPASPSHHSRGGLCTTPGCRDCGRSTVLHPSGQVYRSRP